MMMLAWLHGSGGQDDWFKLLPLLPALSSLDLVLRNGCGPSLMPALGACQRLTTAKIQLLEPE